MRAMLEWRGPPSGGGGGCRLRRSLVRHPRARPADPAELSVHSECPLGDRVVPRHGGGETSARLNSPHPAPLGSRTLSPTDTRSSSQPPASLRLSPSFQKTYARSFHRPYSPLIPSHLRGRDERSAGGGRGMGCRPPPPPAVPSPAGVNLHPGSGSVRAALAGSAGRGVPAALAGATRQGPAFSQDNRVTSSAGVNPDRMARLRPQLHAGRPRSGVRSLAGRTSIAAPSGL